MMMLMMMVGSGDDAQEFTLNYIGATRFAFHSLVVDTWEVGNQYLSLGLGISSSYSEAIDTQRLETVYRVHIICRGRQTGMEQNAFPFMTWYRLPGKVQMWAGIATPNASSSSPGFWGDGTSARRGIYRARRSLLHRHAILCWKRSVREGGFVRGYLCVFGCRERNCGAHMASG